jgi:alcohol dehydrogenase, propanol-preferring
MRAMVLPKVVSLNESARPLDLRDLPIPQPDPGEVRIRVAACGVCHTELDEIEGRTPPPKLPMVLGHEVVGYVDQLGKGVAKLRMGDRVGVGWIHSSTGEID